ncbi:ASP-1 protein [Aphelenchoides avenae]|nr:ASP-1 protein [Aphelenchus avenae]
MTVDIKLDGVISPSGVDSLTVTQVPFFLANEAEYSLNPGWASDGVFPLAMKASDDALAKILYAAGGRRVLTLWLNGSPNDGAPAPGGQITFGGPDTANCDANWHKVISNDNWSVKLKSVTVGAYIAYNDDYPDEFGVPISIASSMLIVPSAVFDGLIRPFHAEYNFDLDLYTVDCGRVASLPGVTISIDAGINGFTYTVPAEKFVAKVNTKIGQKCALLIVDGLGEWAIGSQFLPQRCVFLDYDQQTIGFAAAK